ncbi:hypothetical protein L596_014576 [Steinernema carpocapsae]|uniref:Carboxypeptidase n=1 Tax=Steinernema carpocapsae TaxID=34508 RepID=A0A4U5ND38_STECR|nr:hypothetical protein L596_014576 [Steinernema carpocapsae]
MCWVEWIYLLVIVVGCGSAAPVADKIGNLPGLDFVPLFDQYSGYLVASSTKKHFYWFTESERNPSSDPVILWLNGGPGCSSLQGLLTEMGPYRVRNYGAKVVQNEFAWNKIANIIYMESPAGVGFSYDTTGSTTYTDDEVAIYNQNALIHFFDKFPEFQGNDFYIAGESYAGTYVPMLAARLINDKVNFPKFKGMAVGNGCLNDRLLFNSVIQFSYNHGFIDENYFRSAVKKCCPGGAAECDWHSYSQLNDSAKCNSEAMTLNMANFYTGLDPYFLYFTCYLDSPARPSVLKSTMRRFLAKKFGHSNEVSSHAEPACAHHDDDILWLNRKDVRRAIHVPTSLPAYSSCNQDISQNYVTQYFDMTPFVRQALDAKLRILFFNGDVDSVCNVMHNAQFLADLNLPVLLPSKPWNVPSEKPPSAGFYTKYEGLDFLTVRGAGHFAASEAEKPLETLQMINNFLLNRDYSIPFSN